MNGDELRALVASCVRGDREARRLLRIRRRDRRSTTEQLEIAAALTASGAHRTAALWLAEAYRRAPGSPQVAYKFGNALRMARRIAAARSVLETLCKQHLAWREPALSLAWLKRLSGDAEGAAGVLERWLRAVGMETRSLLAVSGFLQEMRLDERAERLFATVSQDAFDAGLLVEYGSLLLKLGRFAKAETVLREALRRAPHHGGAWLRLAQVRRWETETESPLAAMRRVLRQARLAEPDRAAIGFAIVKVEDDLGDYDAAWRAAEQANALRSRSASFDRSAWERYEAALSQVYTQDFFASNVAANAESPIFIIGMPRSGTTLVERRLGMHSDLVPAGELDVVERLGIELAGEAGYPDALVNAGSGDISAAAQRWHELLPAGLSRRGSIVDKNPMNFLHLGLIARLFPQARIVHCTRDPLDTALSIWFQNFAHPRNDYAYQIGDIAWMYAFYRRIMRFWESVLPLRFYEVQYERLVRDPEGELRQLLSGMSLRWDPAVLSARGRDGEAIATASLWQARQPVYRRAAGRARHYEPWIGSLQDALARQGVLCKE